uniref:Leucine-rich repeat-containing N-terminal plant-type domain-containing protein n=1 Tax=Fagus sylvatica TaxID=28930 RepID=A0A2N9G8W1_FAGSY
MQPLCHVDESSALLQFKESFIINGSDSSNKLACPLVQSTPTAVSWDGGICDKDTGHVIDLDMSSSCLFGSVNSNSSLFQLVHLQRLNLAYNNFNYSQIPSQGRAWSLLIDEKCTNATLPKFYGLDLASCNLSEFPHFLRNQDELQWLSLAYNNITGHVPEWMWNISIESLRVMDLSFNSLRGFDHFPIPLPWINLAILDYSSNQLEGSLPIPPFTTLRYHIPNNKLSGKIPQWICNMDFSTGA